MNYQLIGGNRIMYFEEFWMSQTSITYIALLNINGGLICKQVNDNASRYFIIGKDINPITVIVLDKIRSLDDASEYINNNYRI